MKPSSAQTFAAALGVFACIAGCGASAPPAAQSAPAQADQGAASSPAASPSSPASAPVPGAPAADATTPPSRPLDLTNSCPHDMHVYYGDNPGDGKGQAATVATGAVVQVPRGADGTLVLWVTDDKGAGLASVHITKHMRHVRIGSDCSKIDADSTR